MKLPAWIFPINLLNRITALEAENAQLRAMNAQLDRQVRAEAVSSAGMGALYISSLAAVQGQAVSAYKEAAELRAAFRKQEEIAMRDWLDYCAKIERDATQKEESP